MFHDDNPHGRSDDEQGSDARDESFTAGETDFESANGHHDTDGVRETTIEQWRVEKPTTLEIDGVTKVDLQAVRAHFTVLASDEATSRIRITAIEGKDALVQFREGVLSIDHPEMSTKDLGTWAKKLKQLRIEATVSVPRETVIRANWVAGDLLVSGIAGDVKTNAVSADCAFDGTSGNLRTSTVSGDVTVRNHRGSVRLNTVSGTLTAAGALTEIDSNSVSGSVMLDIVGARPRTIKLNSVSGGVTVRLPNDVAPNISVTALSGRVQVGDTVEKVSMMRSFSRRFEGGSSIVDISCTTVSGDVSVFTSPLASDGGAAESSAATRE